jgi:transketolase C-terminal domain/subunit
MPGLRFLFTIRSKTPSILKEDGSQFFGAGYEFVPGKDDIIRKGTKGYVIAFGDALYRCMDAVERLREEGLDIGLICKATLNKVRCSSLSCSQPPLAT